MLQTETIKYKDSFYDVTIIVKQATFAEGLRRSGIQGREVAKQTDLAIENQLPALAAIHIYPSCLAAVVSIENRGTESITEEPSLEEFMEYPDALVNLWGDAVWGLNPHWSPFGMQPVQSNSSTENSLDGETEKQNTLTKKTENTGDSSDQASQSPGGSS